MGGFFFAIGFLVLFLFGSDPCWAEGVIRVRVKHGLTRLEVSAQGLVSEELGLRPGLPKLTKLSINIIGDKLAISKGSKSWLLSELHLQGDELRVNRKRVPDQIHISLDSSGSSLDVVAKVPLKTYLEGVLPNEMPGLWPLEALKAQAVTTRTYTLKQVRAKKNEKYQLESSIMDQVFNLDAALNIPLKVRKKIKRAILETKGLVLSYKQQLIKAYYHADCGGQTELAENVWGEKERGLNSVRDPLCPLSPNADWETSLSQKSAVEKLVNYLKQKGEVIDEEVIPYVKSLHSSGRVASIGFQGVTTTLSSQEFREALGFNRVKSAKFEIETSGRNLKITGAGHGHGVGLCQWGARQLVLRGLDYKKILQHYYPSAQLQNISQLKSY